MISRTFPPEAYCYLLGLYLGDGCISRRARVWHLRITLDKKYPAIIDRCRLAINILMPGQRAGLVQRVERMRRRFTLSSKHWPCLFPQHGPGKKHTRTSPSSHGSKRLSTRPPRSSPPFDRQRRLPRRRERSWRYDIAILLDRSEDIIGLFTAALDTLVSPGRGRRSTSSPSTAKPPPPDLTNSSGQRTARYLNGVHYPA